MNTILIFIIVISILVFVHELGHFLAAKKAGMKVEEFAIGFKPAIFNKKIGETRYIIGLIPIGGYVKIFGENPEMEKKLALEIKDEGKREARLKEIELSKDRAFSEKSKFWQIVVLSMGVIFNFIFAYLIFLFMVFSKPSVDISDINSSDQKYLVDKQLIMKDILVDSVAFENKLKPDTVISNLYIDGKETDIYSKDFMKNISEAKKEIKINYFLEKMNESERKSFLNGSNMVEMGEVILPVKFNEKGKKEKFGIYFSQESKLDLPFWKNFEYAFKSFSVFSRMIFDGFKDLFSGDVDIDDISGPVGIAKISGEAAQSGFNSILTLLAILSINLGFVNILPFPALDGGRIAIVLAEVFLRRKIPIDTVNMINGIGFLILMLFIIYITYKDIVKIFFK